ncbi:MAG: hypothetical protein MUC97_11510 [Bernardetiaceae bacterium]|jgi:hypothetical protein|nr:hypothetical protein [Bernardetiaceae bacterium]
METSFQVTKWYADVVDEATGRLLIYYWAELHWQNWNLLFSNVLRADGPGQVHSTASFRQTYAPDVGPDHFIVTTPRLRGQWIRQTPQLQLTLHQQANGHIHWHGHLPCAQATATWAQTPPLVGLGYVEKLTFTLKPWEMPIRTLYWGRWLAHGHALTWIRWAGPVPRNWLIYNGQLHEDADIDENGLRFGPYQIDLKAKQTLRDGSVWATVFRRFGWLKALVPSGVFNLYEQKWLTRATLALGTQPQAQGWAIHEKVAWI